MVLDMKETGSPGSAKAKEFKRGPMDVDMKEIGWLVSAKAKEF